MVNFDAKTIKKYKIKYPTIRILECDTDQIVGNIGNLWAYGNSINDVRAYLSVAVYDACLEHNRGFVMKAIKNKSK